MLYKTLRIEQDQQSTNNLTVMLPIIFPHTTVTSLIDRQHLTKKILMWQARHRPIVVRHINQFCTANRATCLSLSLVSTNYQPTTDWLLTTSNGPSTDISNNTSIDKLPNVLVDSLPTVHTVHMIQWVTTCYSIWSPNLLRRYFCV